MKRELTVMFSWRFYSLLFEELHGAEWSLYTSMHVCLCIRKCAFMCVCVCVCVCVCIMKIKNMLARVLYFVYLLPVSSVCVCVCVYVCV